MKTSDESPVYSMNAYDEINECIMGCGRMLSRQTQRRVRPDVFCSVCYELWKEHLGSAWVRYLENQQRVKRRRLKRLTDLGIPVVDVSLDVLMERTN